MARRYPPLSERQVAVLGWVARGCPDGVWGDFTYKHSTYALAERGLVTVDRRRHSWSAQLTDRGRYYLQHGAYPPSPAVTAAPTGSPHRTREDPQTRYRQRSSAREVTDDLAVSPGQLISELQAKDGMLTVTAPAPPLRGAYRRAINRAITERLVPEGYVLRHQGRDRGDLVIRLIPRDEAELEREHLPLVPLPGSLQGAHPAVRELRDHRPDLLDVGEESRRRALLILQAIANECQRRGYEFGLRADGEPTFQLTVGGTAFGFTLSEEYERREVPDPHELATAKYEWQRIPAIVRQVRSGRLVIRLGGPRSTIFWADRKRWTLAEKLSFLFRHVQLAAQKIATQRAEAEVRRQERRQAWEEALVRARQAYLDDLNRRRLEDQLADATRAEQLRRYAAQVQDRATGLDDADLTRHAQAWGEWMHAEADRIDPLLHPDTLIRVEPEEISPGDLDRFMPRGMSAWRPPD